MSAFSSPISLTQLASRTILEPGREGMESTCIPVVLVLLCDVRSCSSYVTPSSLDVTSLCRYISSTVDR